jgi:hypothetical protein
MSCTRIISGRCLKLRQGAALPIYAAALALDFAADVMGISILYG